MTLDQLFIWHREQQERWDNLAENNKANLPAVYKASLKRTYQAKADFHSHAVALLKTVRAASPDNQAQDVTSKPREK
ncbi:hypothetical protein PQR39_26310 [Paraburkholderia sediminicola]|uniref:hypothetical protein n=1 Tax=Paraburkholderia sediminicola TaxID=458836 RepID=UPI0038B9788A